MTSRKYVICVTSLLYAFMILNIVMWHCLTKNAFVQNDLNRLGSFISTESLTPNANYSKHHTDFNDYLESPKRESFDVITLGDSFSRREAGFYYQDYLEEKYNIRCLNVNFTDHCLNDLYALINSGMLSEIKPQAVILESAERLLQDRFGVKEIDSEAITAERAKNFINNRRTGKTSQLLASGFFPPVAMQANMDFIKNILYHKIDPERLSPAVYITELDRNFFTNPGYEHTLLYYYEDLQYLNAPLNAEMMNMNLNKAAEILREKGIIPIFMLCADKYDLYYPYIINHNGRPENNFFPEMRRVSPKEYIFIDTMKIFRGELERGEKDIYWFGDTHWSRKGAELVCDELVKYFDWLN